MKTNKLRLLTLFLIAIATITGFLAQTILTTALSPIMLEMEVNAGTVQWLTTVYTLVLAIIVPPTAGLTQRFKTRQLVIASMVCFTVGSAICFIASDFLVLVVGRVLQAAGSGILFPVLTISIFKVLPKEKWNLAMGLAGFAITVAPMLGPTLGGIVIDNFGWRSIFTILTITGAAVVILCIALLTNISDTKEYPLDLPSLILSTFACVGLILGMSNISTFGIGSLWVLIPIAIGILSSFTFVKLQKRLEAPLLNLSVFNSKKFMKGTLLVSLMQLILGGFVVVFSIYVQSICGLSATASGLIVLPGTLFMAVCNLLGGKIADRTGIRFVAVTGNLLMLFSMVVMAFFSTDTPIWLMVVIQFFRLGGLGVIMQSITTWALASVAEKVEDATAVNNTLRNISTAIGSSLLTVIMAVIAGGVINSSAQSVWAFNTICIICAALSIVSLFISFTFEKKVTAAKYR